jgi:hypothetical protein
MVLVDSSDCTLLEVRVRQWITNPSVLGSKVEIVLKTKTLIIRAMTKFSPSIASNYLELVCPATEMKNKRKLNKDGEENGLMYCVLMNGHRRHIGQGLLLVPLDHYLHTQPVLHVIIMTTPR